MRPAGVPLGGAKLEWTSADSSAQGNVRRVLTSVATGVLRCRTIAASRKPGNISRLDRTPSDEAR